MTEDQLDLTNNLYDYKLFMFSYEILIFYFFITFSDAVSFFHLVVYMY
jgi:hypothetical protein